MTVLKVRNLSRGQVNRLLNFQPRYDGSFAALLSLEPLSAAEIHDVERIQREFRNYLEHDKVSEGQIRLVSLAPFLRLANYNEAPIRLDVEEDIARIYIEDEETHITGRLDIVAVHRSKLTAIQTLLWILVVESKNSEASDAAGVAQLLTYAHQSLEQQPSVWGLVTNGITYQFFYLRQGDPRTYQYMPLLTLMERDSAQQILQVLKAIRTEHTS
jgi:hypothetical protein